MKYEGFTTFTVQQSDAILTVTFDFGTVNVQGQEMLADEQGLEHDIENQRNWNELVMNVQEIY